MTLSDYLVAPQHPTENIENGGDAKKFRSLALTLAVVALSTGCVLLLVLPSEDGRTGQAQAASQLVRGPTEGVVSDSTSIYKTQGCPLSQWFSSLPLNLPDWEETLVNNYKTDWQDHCETPSEAYTNPTLAGCPLGFKANDHNYNTVLGQGNTLGFVAGHLRIHLDGLPDEVQHGLFARSQTLPLVLRLSDFGADDSSVRLSRAAIKIPFSSTSTSATVCDEPHVGVPIDIPSGSWYDEFNMLFTESLDAFPLANFDAIASFASDPESSTWDKLVLGKDFLAIVANSGLKVATSFYQNLLNREYYSQLPYRMGCKHAVKFALFPKQKKCGWFKKPKCCVKTLTDVSPEGLARAVADHLSRCDAEFELRVQVKDVDHDWEVINREAATSWPEEYIRVGDVIFPRQAIADETTATSSVLKAALVETLPLSPGEADGIHKLFMFHPLLNPNDHQPLGEVNAFRSHFYSEHATARYGTLLSEVEAKSSNPKPPYKFPFGKFQGATGLELKELWKQVSFFDK